MITEGFSGSNSGCKGHLRPCCSLRPASLSLKERIDMDLCDIGLIGLGVMGRNLVLNIADHGFSAGPGSGPPGGRKAVGSS
jgi:hypothetical protein